MLAILSNSFFSMVKPAKEKIRIPRKNKGTHLSFSMSYLILKKIKPRTGKKKKRPKIKFSFVYKFFFFKKRSPSQLPTPALTQFIFSEKSNLRLALVIGSYFMQKQIILIKYVTYLYYKNDHSSTQIGLLRPHGIFQLLHNTHRFPTGCTSA